MSMDVCTVATVLFKCDNRAIHCTSGSNVAIKKRHINVGCRYDVRMLCIIRKPAAFPTPMPGKTLKRCCGDLRLHACEERATFQCRTWRYWRLVSSHDMVITAANLQRFVPSRAATRTAEQITPAIPSCWCDDGSLWPSRHY